MKINVSYSSGGDVSCNGHCQSDFDDIRFVDIDNTTVLPYWKETYVDSQYAIFWVNVSADAMSDGKILMYYGNSGATDASDADATLEYYEDFTGSDGTDPDGWTDANNFWSIDSNRYNAPDTDGDMKQAYITDSGIKNCRIRAKMRIATYQGYVAIVARRQSNGACYWFAIRYNSGTSYRHAYAYYWSGSGNTKLFDDTGQNYITSNWHDVEVRIYENTADIYVDDTLRANNIDLGNYITSAGQVGLTTWNDGDRYVDDFIVTKYVEPEPVWDSFGEEQVYSGNSPPSVSNPSPSNGATDVPISTSQLSVDISDPEGDLMNWTIETSPNIGNASGNNAGNGTITCSISGLDYGTTYTWYVNVTDGNSWTNETYTFTTEELMHFAKKFIIHNTSGTSSGEHIYLNGNASHFPNDIVVTGEDGTTKIPYFIDYTSSDDVVAMWVYLSETQIDNESGVGWLSGFNYRLKHNVSFADTYRHIYFYFGNSSMTESESNGSAVFDWFIDYRDTHDPTLLTSDASAGDVWIHLEDVSSYVVGEQLQIMDDSDFGSETGGYQATIGNAENITIEAINYSNNTIKISSPLTNSYSVAQNAKVSRWYRHQVYSSATNLATIRYYFEQNPLSDYDNITSYSSLKLSLYDHDSTNWAKVGLGLAKDIALSPYTEDDIMFYHISNRDASGATTTTPALEYYYRDNSVSSSSADWSYNLTSSNIVQGNIILTEMWTNSSFVYFETYNTSSNYETDTTASSTSNVPDYLKYPFVRFHAYDDGGDMDWKLEYNSTENALYMYASESSSHISQVGVFLYWWGITKHVEAIADGAYTFESLNNAPQLSNPSATPSSGVADYTIFYFNVTYSDPDGDPPVEIRVNISKTGWYLNASMSYISGDNTTGALYSYSTTLPAGTYDYLFYANDGTYSTVNDPTDQVTVEAQSYSFTVSTADPSGQENFTASATMGAEWNVSASYQTSSIPAIQITNTGNVPINISINLTSAPISNVHIKYNTSSTPPSFTQNPYYCDKELTTTPVTVLTIEVGGTGDIWLWADFENKTNPGSYTTKLYIASSFGG